MIPLQKDTMKSFHGIYGFNTYGNFYFAAVIYDCFDCPLDAYSKKAVINEPSQQKWPVNPYMPTCLFMDAGCCGSGVAAKR